MIRLSDHEISIIKQAFLSTFNPDDQLWIFGSRVDPDRKGGDIDLYIKTQYHNLDTLLDLKIKFHLEIERGLGERKIDIVINTGHQQLKIYDIAETTGVKLI
ncbi:MAG: hypothetical protein KF798_02780 [Candidatus Paracaedibacteraceae bacterium]|nr:hypothetical protein [Candidatus Paracaedibacteraceae bacterium]